MQEYNAHHQNIDADADRRFDDLYDSYAFTQYGIEF